MKNKFNKEMLQCYFVAGTQDFNNSKIKLLKKLDSALSAGITAFQFREKDGSKLSVQEKIQLGKQIKQLCIKYNVPLFVDDDVELAQKIEADGVHVGQKDEKIENVISTLRNKMMIGYSCNTLEEINKANALNIDYIGAGPIFPTNSKPDADPTIGVDILSKLIKTSQHPIVAIGGINEHNIEKLNKRQCAGIAVISYLAQSNDIKKAIKTIKNITEGY